ncbi:MAG: hypothetical protein ABMA14_06775 [Hyphomonadaceae bacterium]
MSQPDAKATRTTFEQVQAILHADWDPIGCGVPLNEYDSYAWPVVRMLQEGAGREALTRHLRRAADEQMQCPVPEERLLAVVERLMTLG